MTDRDWRRRAGWDNQRPLFLPQRRAQLLAGIAIGLAAVAVAVALQELVGFPHPAIPVCIQLLGLVGATLLGRLAAGLVTILSALPFVVHYYGGNGDSIAVLSMFLVISVVLSQVLARHQ